MASIIEACFMVFARAYPSGMVSKYFKDRL